jgi:predicted dehydrogenase
MCTAGGNRSSRPTKAKRENDDCPYAVAKRSHPVKPKTTRRQFLTHSGAAISSAALSAPLVVPAAVLGRDSEKLAPSERITMACVGVGGRGGSNLRIFKRKKEAQIVAICDVDLGHLCDGLSNAGIDAKDGYKEFTDVLQRQDIDTVMVGTPDHWHALISIAAVEVGKDVYCEKPMAASIAESQAMVLAVSKHNRILQCGTQRRSMAGCRFACELVRNGRIGTVKRVEVGVPGQFAIRGDYTGNEAEQPVPLGFDYRAWLGPCPAAPYTAARCHFNFRWVRDYAPGYITDWGAHYLDIVQWGLGADHLGPVGIDAQDVHFRDMGIYNAPEKYRIIYTYASGVQVILMATDDKKKWGMRFYGDHGNVYVESQNVITDPSSIKTTKIGPNEIHLYNAGNDHHGNFLDCVKTRNQPSAPVQIGHRSATVCQLGAISCLLGRKLTWDPESEHFVDDEEANQHRSRPMREPWTLS